MKRYRFRSQCGITLLEVLVATAIASIVLLSFLTLVIGSLDLEENARRVTEATMIADDKLKEIERGELPEPGIVEGLIDENDPNGYAFRRAISETMIENVFLVEYEIFWNKKRNSVSLITYILKKADGGNK